MRGKVGDVHVAQLTRDIDAAIGVEPVGVFILPELGFYPNSIAAALTLLMSIKDISEIREFINRIPPLYLGQLKISCANDKKEALKKLIIDKAHLFGSGAINTLDGLRMDFERSWILVRPSGTNRFSVLLRNLLRQQKQRGCWKTRPLCFENWQGYRL